MSDNTGSTTVKEMLHHLEAKCNKNPGIWKLLVTKEMEQELKMLAQQMEATENGSGDYHVFDKLPIKTDDEVKKCDVVDEDITMTSSVVNENGTNGEKASGYSHNQCFNAFYNLPTGVAGNLIHGSFLLSMQLCHVQRTLLLVGFTDGNIALGEVCSWVGMVLKNLRIWDLTTCSIIFQAVLVKDLAVFINHIIEICDPYMFRLLVMANLLSTTVLDVEGISRHQHDFSYSSKDVIIIDSGSGIGKFEDILKMQQENCGLIRLKAERVVLPSINPQNAVTSLNHALAKETCAATAAANEGINSSGSSTRPVTNNHWKSGTRRPRAQNFETNVRIDNYAGLQDTLIFNIVIGGTSSGLSSILQNRWKVLPTHVSVQPKLFDPGILFNNVEISNRDGFLLLFREIYLDQNFMKSAFDPWGQGSSEGGRNAMTSREANNEGYKDGVRVKEHVEVRLFGTSATNGSQEGCKSEMAIHSWKKYMDSNLVEIRSGSKKEDSAIKKSSGSKGNECAWDVDALLSSEFSVTLSEDHMKEEKTQGVDFLYMLEKEFYHRLSLCERKCGHINYEEALQALENLCSEEGKKRETTTGFVHRSYEPILRKCKEEFMVIVSIGDHLDFEVYLNIDDLKQQERKRKLKKTLKYQRWIKNESMQKHIAEQSKGTIQEDEEIAVDGLHNAYLDDGNLGVQQHWAMRTPKDGLLLSEEWTRRTNRQLQAEEDDPWGQGSTAVGGIVMTLDVKPAENLLCKDTTVN